MNTDYLYEINAFGGGVGSHNGRCSRGLTSPDVHMAAEFHVRIEGWCGNVCGQCSRELSKRTGAIVRELTATEKQEA